LYWTKSSVVADDSCHVHSLLPLIASNQVQGLGYSESEVETDVATLQLETYAASLELDTDAAALELEPNAAGLELETDIVALDLETEIDMPQGLSKQERYSAN
jgi:hypothetical protein